jgi:hypothetical protein
MLALTARPNARIGKRSPVLVAKEVDWSRDYSKLSIWKALDCSTSELSTIDPLALNLVVAKGIPTLASIDISYYQRIANDLASDFRDRCLPTWEPYFFESPDAFHNDLDFFRFGMLSQYLDTVAGVKYRADQRHIAEIEYLNPSDLFLNGVLDTMEGTCGNMSALNVAIAWRLRWPVSLACIGSHFISRFDDGNRVYNLETTDTGRGGWSAPDDAKLIERDSISPTAIESGSDLRALTFREMLGCFVALRARHVFDLGTSYKDNQKMIESESDWLLARSLFPSHRVTYRNQMAVTAMRGAECFSASETGHPISFAIYLTTKFRGNQRAPEAFSDSISCDSFFKQLGES